MGVTLTQQKLPSVPLPCSQSIPGIQPTCSLPLQLLSEKEKGIRSRKSDEFLVSAGEGRCGSPCQQQVGGQLAQGEEGWRAGDDQVLHLINGLVCVPPCLPFLHLMGL